MPTTKTVNGIQVLIVDNYAELCDRATRIIIERAKANPRLRLLVPTGTTPVGVYALMAKTTGVFDAATFFNMDEYLEQTGEAEYEVLETTDKRGYRYYMQEHLFGALPVAGSYFPGVENVAKPGTYDRLIADAGGLDFCLNAVGEDGHTFGFNIPGSSFESVTRMVALNDDTKAANAKITGFETPQSAVSVGLLTGMSSAEVLMLVSGTRKAEILRKVLHEDISEDIPATILRRHRNCTWIVDKEAARLI